MPATIRADKSPSAVRGRAPGNRLIAEAAPGAFPQASRHRAIKSNMRMAAVSFKRRRMSSLARQLGSNAWLERRAQPQVVGGRRDSDPLTPRAARRSFVEAHSPLVLPPGKPASGGALAELGPFEGNLKAQWRRVRALDCDRTAIPRSPAAAWFDAVSALMHIRPIADAFGVSSVDVARVLAGRPGTFQTRRTQAKPEQTGANRSKPD